MSGEEKNSLDPTRRSLRRREIESTEKKPPDSRSDGIEPMFPPMLTEFQIERGIDEADVQKPQTKIPDGQAGLKARRNTKRATATPAPNTSKDFDLSDYIPGQSSVSWSSQRISFRSANRPGKLLRRQISDPDMYPVSTHESLRLFVRIKWYDQDISESTLVEVPGDQPLEYYIDELVVLASSLRSRANQTGQDYQILTEVSQQAMIPSSSLISQGVRNNMLLSVRSV